MDAIAIISLLIGIISTAIAIYQAAVLREGSKRKREIQYLLASINHAALQKQQSWNNQINTIQKLESEQDYEMGRLYIRARDDFAELAALAVPLEGVIEVDSSAIEDMMKKSLNVVRLNNQLQEEGLKNPTTQNTREQTDKEH